LEITQKILLLNPFARIIQAIHADYKEKQIIGNQLFNINKFDTIFRGITIDHKHLNNKNNIGSISIEVNGDFDLEKFSYWIEYFLLMNQSTIYRAKGILSFKGNSRKQIFQAVKFAFSIEEGNFWATNEKRSNKLIFIGKDLNKKVIKSGLQSLLAD